METRHTPPALIPERNTPDGPVTTQQLRRTAIGYLVLAATGTVIARRAAHGRAANLGVGLIAPGAGYLSAGKPVRFLAAVGGFVTSLVMWLGSGNMLAPITVWIATALGALRHDLRRPLAKVTVPLTAVVVVCAGIALRGRTFRTSVKGRPARNKSLGTLGATTGGRFVSSEKRKSTPPVPELSTEQLE